MAGPLPRATAQYWTVTPSDGAQANGPIRRLWVGGTGTLVLGSGDGSSVTLDSVPAGQWVAFDYPIQIVATASTATDLIAEGWGAPGTAGAAP